VLSSARHFQGGAPRVELSVEAAVGLAEAIVVICPGRGLGGAGPGELFNPFSEGASGDPMEMTARLELSIARSIARSLGYAIEAEGGPGGARVVVKLR
jgi:K+-sensing histidine kinase KdpD